MRNLFMILMVLCLGASSLFGFDDTEATKQAGSLLDIVFLGAKVIGAIAIILGIVELLVEKDQGGQQGKKASGSMKLVGGTLLLVAAGVIQWAMGDGTDKNGSSILGAKASGAGDKSQKK